MDLEERDKEYFEMRRVFWFLAMVALVLLIIAGLSLGYTIWFQFSLVM